MSGDGVPPHCASSMVSSPGGVCGWCGLALVNVDDSKIRKIPAAMIQVQVEALAGSTPVRRGVGPDGPGEFPPYRGRALVSKAPPGPLAATGSLTAESHLKNDPLPELPSEALGEPGGCHAGVSLNLLRPLGVDTHTMPVVIAARYLIG
ncbi:hypothetical protein SCUP234_11700 [Seiridium cupressi]